MSKAAFLQRFSVLSTSDPDELRAWIMPMFAVRAFDMPAAGRDFDCALNHRQLGDLSLTYARYGSPLVARLQQNDFFVQGIPVSGKGEVRWNRHALSVAVASGGVAGGPGSEGTLSYDGDFSHLIVKFSPAALTRKLSAILGQPIDPPLRLTDAPDGNPLLLGGQTRLVRFLADELDQAEGQLPPTALAEIEQAILVTFLLGTSHNYSHWLRGKLHTVAPRQVKNAADYIEQNWDRPITIEALSHVTQISARSLFHLFKRTYGVSPMAFARRARLRRAREMLSHPAPETTVTSVGFLCGFGNPGRFAKSYFEAFGELPSDTLKANR